MLKPYAKRVFFTEAHPAKFRHHRYTPAVMLPCFALLLLLPISLATETDDDSRKEGGGNGDMAGPHSIQSSHGVAVGKDTVRARGNGHFATRKEEGCPFLLSIWSHSTRSRASQSIMMASVRPVRALFAWEEGCPGASEACEEPCRNPDSRCTYRQSNWHRDTMCCSSSAASAGWVTPARLSAPPRPRPICTCKRAHPKTRQFDVCLQKPNQTIFIVLVLQRLHHWICKKFLKPPPGESLRLFSRMRGVVLTISRTRLDALSEHQQFPYDIQRHLAGPGREIALQRILVFAARLLILKKCLDCCRQSHGSPGVARTPGYCAFADINPTIPQKM